WGRVAVAGMGAGPRLGWGMRPGSLAAGPGGGNAREKKRTAGNGIMKSRNASGNITRRSIDEPAWNQINPARITMSDERLMNASAPTWPRMRLTIPVTIRARPHQLG